MADRAADGHNTWGEMAYEQYYSGAWHTTATYEITNLAGNGKSKYADLYLSRSNKSTNYRFYIETCLYDGGVKSACRHGYASNFFGGW